MLKGFKDFILRGNVIDLAVAVVIGSAFTAIVTAFTNNLLNPLLAVLGGSEVKGLGIQLVEGNEATFMDFGAVITAAINFLLIAAVVYFVLVAPMNKFKEIQAKRKGVSEDEKTPASIEAELLEEIRDLLKTRNV
ncbi:large conductance mechanosensitive channel protein MscL [Staphylococcus chromogenes]|nr:large conductance mechanosensitive channel protein MscL [Staphylococcus chromogenes]